MTMACRELKVKVKAFGVTSILDRGYFVFYV